MWCFLAKTIEVSNNESFKMGDPYYCQECGRTHQKGKIYQDHFKYSKNPENRKEENEIEDNFEDIEIEDIDDIDDDNGEILDEDIDEEYIENENLI